MALLERVRAALLQPSKSRVAGLVAGYLVLGLILTWRRGLVDGSVPDGIPFYSPSDLADMLRALSPSAGLYAVVAVTVDVLFPVALAGLMAMVLVRSASPAWSRTWLLPVAAVPFDIVENGLVSYLALTFPQGPGALTWLAAVASGAKWVLFSAATLAVVAAAVRERSRLGWWGAGIAWLLGAGFFMTRGPVPTAAWLVALAVVVHRKWLYLGQYLFFLRFPLAVGVAFALLPQISRMEGPSALVGNLFVLESDLQVFFVAFVAGLTAMALMSAARMVYLVAPERSSIALVRAVHVRPRLRAFQRALLDASDRMDAEPAERPALEHRSRRLRKLIRHQLRIENQSFVSELFPFAGPARPLVFVLLALPVLLEVQRRSGESRPFGASAGLLTAVLIGYGILALESRWLRRRRKSNAAAGREPFVARYQQAREGTAGGPVSAVVSVGRAMSDPLHDAVVGLSNPVGALGVLALAFYVLLPLFVSPTSSVATAQGFPAILYVFLILIALTWLLTLLSLRSDTSRMPVVLTAVVILFGLFQLSDSDHRYEVMPRPDGWDLPSATEVVRANLRHDSARRAALGLDPGRDHLTVVAASGGGIKASLWSARVLEALSAQLGPGFSSSIALVSTNSGGSVGGMYFTEAFTPEGPPTPETVADIVRAAASSSLSATVWGMAYPDMLRFVSGGLLVRDGWRARDRGWAMDRTWEAYREGIAGSPEGRPRRLGDWVEGVRDGWRPAHVFNATIVETGAALRLSTVDLGRAAGADPGSVPREFDDLFPRGDIELATAARLSASFPWVSPITSGWMHPDSVAVAAGDEVDADVLEDELRAGAFHVTDGGFFDNFGVYSALEFLLRAGPDSLRAMGIERVALVQIRATPEKPGTPRHGGLTYSLAGPILAMNSVRTSSQIGRNELAIRQLAQAWDARGVRLCSLVFQLEQAGPLSWHLSSAEQEALRAAWTAEHERAADLLARFIGVAPAGAVAVSEADLPDGDGEPGAAAGAAGAAFMGAMGADAERDDAGRNAAGRVDVGTGDSAPATVGPTQEAYGGGSCG